MDAARTLSVAGDLTQVATRASAMADDVTRGLGELAERSEAMVGELHTQLAAIRVRMQELRAAAAGADAAESALSGPRLLDTKGLPGGPYPAGTPVVDVTRGADDLGRHVFTSPIAAAWEGGIDARLRSPLHRDVARMIGHPVVSASAPEGGAIGLAYVRGQVGRLEGYLTPEHASYAARTSASRSGTPVVVLRGTDDAGSDRHLLAQLDQEAFAEQATEIRPLTYGLENGDTAPALSIAMPDGSLHQLDAATATAAPDMHQSLIAPLEEIDPRTVVHYDHETAAQLTELSAQEQRVSQLVRELDAARGGSGSAKVVAETTPEAASKPSRPLATAVEYPSRRAMIVPRHGRVDSPIDERNAAMRKAFAGAMEDVEALANVKYNDIYEYQHDTRRHFAASRLKTAYFQPMIDEVVLLRRGAPMGTPDPLLAARAARAGYTPHDLQSLRSSPELTEVFESLRATAIESVLLHIFDVSKPIPPGKVHAAAHRAVELQREGLALTSDLFTSMM